MNRKPRLADSLKKSLDDEKKSVQDRFEKAEALLDEARVRREPRQKPVEKRPPVIRDGFTMPVEDHALFDVLKERALRLGRVANKSEIARAGLKALASMDDEAFVGTLARVERIKAGRPK